MKAAMDVRAAMSLKSVTVSEVSALIEEREQSLEELLKAYEHWCELEARIVELSRRMDALADAAPRKKP